MKKFKDVYGNIWFRGDSWGFNYVFNNQLGLGLWDNGKGLTEI